jgi:ankyrin repeat protein
MSKGMKIGSLDDGGSTTLHWACYSSAEAAVSALIAWGVELDVQ